MGPPLLGIIPADADRAPKCWGSIPEIQAAKKAEEEREAEAKRHLAGFLRDGEMRERCPF